LIQIVPLAPREGLQVTIDGLRIPGVRVSVVAKRFYFWLTLIAKPLDGTHASSSNQGTFVWDSTLGLIRREVSMPLSIATIQKGKVTVTVRIDHDDSNDEDEMVVSADTLGMNKDLPIRHATLVAAVVSPTTSSEKNSSEDEVEPDGHSDEDADAEPQAKRRRLLIGEVCHFNGRLMGFHNVRGESYFRAQCEVHHACFMQRTVHKIRSPRPIGLLWEFLRSADNCPSRTVHKLMAKEIENDVGRRVVARAHFKSYEHHELLEQMEARTYDAEALEKP
jgi:hypothetical protein